MKTILIDSLILLLLLTTVGCGAKTPASDEVIVPEAVAISVDHSLTLVSVGTATFSECAHGGSTIRLFKDENSNGDYDSGETVISATPVCNGAPGVAGTNGTNGTNGANGIAGAQGAGAGIRLSSAPLQSCPAGGTFMETFQDLNNNAFYDVGESITSSSTICNGVKGVDGLNGASSFITSSLASSAQCSAGGVVYSTHLDGQAPQLSIVCNGANGVNGTNGTNGANGTNGVNGTNGANASFSMGAVGPVIEKEGYSACHHDYLFIPDASGEGRGWLIFRHQKNGTDDQDSKKEATGFNVWSVDVADFNLVSENSKVTYCRLHWEASKRVLSYTVVDEADGYAGYSDSIEMKE